MANISTQNAESECEVILWVSGDLSFSKAGGESEGVASIRIYPLL